MNHHLKLLPNPEALAIHCLQMLQWNKSFLRYHQKCNKFHGYLDNYS